MAILLGGENVSSFNRLRGQTTLENWRVPRQTTLEEHGVRVRIYRPLHNIRQARKEGKGDAVLKIEGEEVAEDIYAHWSKMEKELDEWDGSIDNQEKAVEDHVSKYGELF